jgi:hypothetical protein
VNNFEIKVVINARSLEGKSDVGLVIERKLRGKSSNTQIYLELYDFFIWLELPPRARALERAWTQKEKWKYGN